MGDEEKRKDRKGENKEVKRGKNINLEQALSVSETHTKCSKNKNNVCIKHEGISQRKEENDEAKNNMSEMEICLRWTDNEKKE